MARGGQLLRTARVVPPIHRGWRASACGRSASGSPPTHIARQTSPTRSPAGSCGVATC